MKLPVVYVPMSADIIHPGHIQLLKEALKYGDVIVGLLSDEAIKEKKGKWPVMVYDERFEVVSNLVGVRKVIQQDSPDYTPNLEELEPIFVVHGNDWPEEARQSVLITIKQWDGKLIEVDYSSSPTSSTIIKKRVIDQSV
ncbi:MAG TPA: adenylyltransferase/cytidyltransferase family protein [Candidatus Saccharimonadales bacterium]|nr:adenylyltransferase/cytidyltransferase family protein [Candidatus Saccharimonadales bacterium]